MAFQVSPGVNVSEIDLTTVVPAVSSTEGGIAGAFRWGPVNDRVNVSSELELVSSFGKPSDDNFETFHVASSFLAYGNQLYVVRAADANAYNAFVNTSAAAADLQVKNLDDYLTKPTGTGQGANFRAKYPGVLGNSLKISICDSANAYQSNVMSSVDNANNTLTFAVNVGANTGTLTSTQASQNVVSITVSAGGSGYNNTDVIVLSNGASNTGNCTITTNSTGGITSVTVVGGGQFPNTSVIVVQVANSTAGANSTNGNTSAGSSAAFTVTLGSTAAANSLANTELYTQLGLLTAGDKLKVGSQYLKISAIGAGTGVSNGVVRSTISFEDRYTGSSNVSQQTNSISASAVTRFWEYFDVVDSAPGTSAYVADRGGSSDELHVVIADEDGQFTGVKNTVLEKFERLSRATDAKREGAGIYYKDVLNDSSEYVWWFRDLSTAASANSSTVAAASDSKPTTKSFTGGSDGGGEANIAFSYLATAYDKFASAEEVDISLVLTGKARGGTYGEQLANYLIDNVAEKRKDCVIFASPDRGDVVGVTSGQADNVVEFRNALRSTSYGVLDSGYKYTYDRYNDLYRFVPLNGDTAGLCVRTDNLRDPWWSPAGFNRGQIKNIVKLAYNPDKADRDTLYKAGVNPVTTFPGQGTVLFGDKTLLAKPSAFDRINVRRLFIVLEKAIATAAKSTLFEFNDDFTRAQFRNLVEPYLREIQGRRGIYDFKVVCDTTNNTPEVIDSNQFIGDIYIKPARSINFIQLNFVAVRTGVEFSEVVGQF